jgi:hypothetical protein
VRAAGLLGCALAGAVALGGCGNVTVDHRQIEQQLVALVAGQEPGATASAACPAGIVARQGVAFRCTVRIDNDQVEYTVTVTAMHGSHYETSAAPSAAVVDTTQVASAVRQQIGSPVTVSCGKARFVQVPAGATLSCQVVAGGHTQTLVIDDQGRFTFGGNASTTTTAPNTPATLPGD